ncbi:MAG TPA: L-threonylcarbamoyladenylate synthase [Bryobacteraceae bacterium]|nr:L-threonylcarbamoyladenylate synthase [Bryobacteraceae bacterium]
MRANGGITLWFILRAATKARYNTRELASNSEAVHFKIYSDQPTVPTDLIEVDNENPGGDAISRAADVIRRGGVVAIPSDALYTLVADPMNLQAVVRVYKAKGREPNRSLPLLVSDLLMAEELAKQLDSRFYLLARHFWPGPLTMIVPSSAKVPLRVTGNTGRLALRHSKSPVAQALTEHLGQAVISTSANISGQPTCRTGIEVFAVMDGSLDLVLDGGLCTGEGSTTIDVTDPSWKLIKEGTISQRDIHDCLNQAGAL